MKINLIFPDIADRLDVLDSSSLLSDVFSRFLGLGKHNYMPPLSLLMLAAATPPDIEVKVIDERVEKIDFDEPVDLVGITVVTRSAPKAYQIAKEYQKRGVKVVLGGIHPSALPKEAVLHADAIVLGEGEGIWPEVLEDFQQGALKPIYRGCPQMDLDKLPFPRRELLRYPDMYVTTKALSSTRGCPNTCTFCSAGIGLTKKYRKRSVESVVRELEQTPGKIAIFVDDNFGWDQEHAKALIRALIPLRLRWSASMSVNTLDDQELIELAAESGCFMIGVGLESISPSVIASIRKDKTNRPERYAEAINRLQKAGIITWGSFIVGFDEDNLQTFSSLVDFIQRTNLEMANVYTLIPYPGSVIYRQYEREGRLLHKDWRYYDPAGGSVVYQPKQMAPEELMDGYIRVIEELFSWKSILGRVIRADSWLSFGSLAALHLNIENHTTLPAEKAQAQSYKEAYLFPDLEASAAINYAQ